MKNKTLILFILIGIALWLVGIIVLDPDFGWHLKMGELIREHGIPTTDPFSYTMPSFPFVDHEWLSDVIISILFTLTGKSGLSMLFTVIALVAIYMSYKLYPDPKRANATKHWEFAIALAVLTSFVPFFGIRPQVLSWLFVAILLNIILLNQRWNRYRFILPPLFLLWANLHGSFIAGIAILLLVICSRSARKQKLSISDFTIFLLCLLTTFVNPYGTQIYNSVWMQISDGSVRWTIYEWFPFFISPISFSAIGLISLSIALVIKYRSKFYFEETILYITLLIQALSSIRHLPLWLIFVFPITLRCIQYLYEEAKKYHAAPRFVVSGKFSLLLIATIATIQLAIYFISSSTMSETNFYPQKAIERLKEIEANGQIFSAYNWGGYLIWKYPQKKVFIDGRMVSWKWQKNLPNESNYVFEEYLSIVKGKIPINDVFEKYEVTTILLPHNKPQYSTLVNNLEKSGWTKTYEDNLSVIYRK